MPIWRSKIGINVCWITKRDNEDTYHGAGIGYDHRRVRRKTRGWVSNAFVGRERPLGKHTRIQSPINHLLLGI